MHGRKISVQLFPDADEIAVGNGDEVFAVAAQRNGVDIQRLQNMSSLTEMLNVKTIFAHTQSSNINPKCIQLGVNLWPTSGLSKISVILLSSSRFSLSLQSGHGRTCKAVQESSESIRIRLYHT